MKIRNSKIVSPRLGRGESLGQWGCVFHCRSMAYLVYFQVGHSTQYIQLVSLTPTYNSVSSSFLKNPLQKSQLGMLPVFCFPARTKMFGLRIWVSTSSLPP